MISINFGALLLKKIVGFGPATCTGKLVTVPSASRADVGIRTSSPMSYSWGSFHEEWNFTINAAIVAAAIQGTWNRLRVLSTES
jgi:hypothetical protein